jgi:hypothetical protein
MLLQHLEDAEKIFSSFKGTLVGVGMTAYSRMIPSFFCKNYHIVSLRKTGDLHILRDKARIFCLEEEMGRTVKEDGFQSARLLAHPLTLSYLRSLPDPKYLFLYQSYPEIEKLGREENWVLLANPSELRVQTGSRLFFNELLQCLKLNTAEGFLVPIQELWFREYRYWAKKVGPRLAVQLPEVRMGGGRGTFFISSEPQFRALRALLEGKIWRGSRLETMTVRRFIEGTPASVALCITGKGTLFSRLQVQLMDLPLSRAIPESGVFCGHSWGGDLLPDSVRDEVLAQTGPIGEHMSRMGYRGILGIDLVVEKGSGRVYPMEINPRLTGAFPMLSQLHLGRGLIPMEIFHILEFLGLPHETDLFSMNREYAKPVKGSHMLLFLMNGRALRNPTLKGGLYEMGAHGESARFVKPAMDYREIAQEKQFIVMDGPPDGDLGSDDPLYRLCRLLFRHPLDGDGGDRLNQALQAAAWAYRQILV